MPSGCWWPACSTTAGARWASSDDGDTVAEMRAGAEQVGRVVKIGPDGALFL